MIGEGEPLQDTDGPSKLDQAKEAVQAASQTVKETTQSVADAIEAPAEKSRHAAWLETSISFGLKRTINGCSNYARPAGLRFQFRLL